MNLINKFFQDILNKAENHFTVNRHGGLYMGDTFITHAHLEADAKRMGIPTSELHANIVELARAEQLANQKNMTRKEILQILENGIKNLEIKEVNPLIDALLSVMDTKGVIMMTNNRNSIILPALDEREALYYNVVGDLFKPLAGVINTKCGTNFSGIDVFNLVIARLRY